MRIVGVASKLHGLEYIENLVDRINNVLKTFSLELDKIITDENDIKGLNEEETIIVVFVLTGGTSRLIRLLREKVNIPMMIVSHPYHNSMPSALSAISRLEANKVGNVAHYHINKINEENLQKVVDIAKTFEYLRNLRVLLIGEPSYEIDMIKNLVNEVIVKSIDDVKELIEQTSLSDEDVKRIVKHIDLAGSENDLLKRALKLYAVVIRLLETNRANSFAIDCFPFIIKAGFTPCITISLLLDRGIPAACEADLRSLLLLAIAQGLTNKPGWIFNPNEYRDSKLIGSHCTVATKLTEYATLLPHFESGNPYAVSGVISEGLYTVAAISPDFKKIAFVKAEVKGLGTSSGGRCRTQALMKLYEKDPRPFTSKALSNHHVLIKGDVTNELEILGKMLGMEVIFY